MTKLEEFQEMAEKLGAQLRSVPAFEKKDKFDVWESADSGGCGSSGCRCSPGLWVSAQEGDKISIAHFGTFTIRQMKEYLAGKGLPVRL